MQDSGTRRRVSSRNGVAAGSVWETRMKMDEVQGGIKVFNDYNESQEDSNSDEEGMRVYEKLRRNQTDSIGGGRRKRRSWGVPEPVDSFFVDKTPIEMQFRQDYDVFDEHEEMEIRVAEEIRNYDDKEMDQPVEKSEVVEDVEKHTFDVVSSQKIAVQHDPEIVSSFEVEKKQNRALQESPKIEKKLDSDFVSKQKVEKQQSVVVSSSEVERKGDALFESTANVKKKRYSVFQAWSKLEKKQNLVAAASRKRDKHNPLTLASVSADKKQNDMFSASDNQVTETVKKTDLNHRNLSSATAPEQVPSRASYGHRRVQSIADLVMWKDVRRSAYVFAFGTFILICITYAEYFNFNSVSVASYLGLVYLASIFMYKSILNRNSGKRIDSKERDERYIVGEEEAIWLLKLVLPYINEMLWSLRAIFCGEPATTMKLAVLLFVMAKCGSSITVWNLAKLTFLGVFTIPKLYSSYFSQLEIYAECWLEMLKDGWESSNHKKAIIVMTFIVVWSISSTAARIWSVFMLIVAMKLYQQWSEEEKIDKVKEEQKSQNRKEDPGLQQQHSFATDRSEVVPEKKLKKPF